MPYPTHSATLLIDALNSYVSTDAGNAFVGEMKNDPLGPDYRAVTIDITRPDWRRLQKRLFAAGWRNFGEQEVIHELPEGCFIVVYPSF